MLVIKNTIYIEIQKGVWIGEATIGTIQFYDDIVRKKKINLVHSILIVINKIGTKE